VDTRIKIIGAPEAAKQAASGAVVVSGYFDPLLASHADRLQELKREGQPLMVLVATPDNPILPVLARCELVAALAVVDHVAEWSSGIRVDARLEPQDAERLEKLIEHVHSRQCVAS